jgi:Tfp pilus assembly protein PilF
MKLRWILAHVRGYLELDMVEDAAAELDRVPSEEAGRVEVLGLRAIILQEQKDWIALQRVTTALVHRQPEDPGWWVMWAYATRRAASLEDAEKILVQAAALHPDDATIQFNLGCYACQKGDLLTARHHVNRAIALDEKFATNAATDPDLTPLRTDQTKL